MVYTVISGLCILFMTGLSLWVGLKYAGQPDAAGRRAYVRGFKIGKCAVIYTVAVPLVTVAEIFEGTNFFRALCDAVSTTAGLVVLKFNFTYALIGANPFFATALYLCYFLVFVNAILLVLSLFHEGFEDIFNSIAFALTPGKRCIIIGNNPDSCSIYGSCRFKRKYIVDLMSKEQADKLFLNGIAHKSFGSNDQLYAWLLKTISSRKSGIGDKKETVIIINTGNEELNMYWCGRICDLHEVCSGSTQKNKTERLFDAYVLGNREYENTYAAFVKASGSVLHYVNEYTLLAIDFTDRYPMTAFMNDGQIDTKTALVDPDVNLNVVMVGFGRTNQQLFLTMVANNQFLTETADENGLKRRTLKKVHYYFFDKNQTDNHKNLNHTYYRYRHSFFTYDKESKKYFQNKNIGTCKDGICEYKRKENGKDGKEIEITEKYLPLPELPAEEEFIRCDINAQDFYDRLKECLTTGKKDVNMIIIALGADSANVDLMNKIVAMIAEDPKLRGNTFYFTRTSTCESYGDMNKYIGEELRNRVYNFGVNSETRCNFGMITNEKYTEAAILRNGMYDVENNMEPEDPVTYDERLAARLGWYNKIETEKESNVYAVLSLRSKLHMIGLDLVKKEEDGEALSREEFYKVYAEGDEPEIETDSENGRVIKKIKYPSDFKESVRRNLAEQEHARWIAFMLSKGFVPSSVSTILNERNAKGEATKGKNYTLRHHGNLTDFDGLVKFRRMAAKAKILAENEKSGSVMAEDEMEKAAEMRAPGCDVIKYDYQLLDGAWWILDVSGFKIVKKKEGFPDNGISEKRSDG